jgi:hypothetical protein
MNREAIMQDFAPKPKVNRLPSLPAENSKKFNILDATIIRQGILLFIVIATIFGVYHYNFGLQKAPVPDDARLFDLVNASGDNTVRQDGAELYFRDNEGIIVGSMIKIDPDTEKMRAKASVDPNQKVGSDLLAILSKY